MGGRFPGTDPSIVAGRAIAGIDTHMVKSRISKVRGVMARGAICSGWHVIDEFANTDYIVMAGFTVVNDTGMIVAASAEGARGVANTAIFDSRHVIERFTARTNTMAGSAIVHDVGMIDECTSEAVGVMARAAIVRGSRMGGHRGCFCARINAVAVVVT